jgi:hypothetical protein
MAKYRRWLHLANENARHAMVVDMFPGYMQELRSWRMTQIGLEVVPVPRGMTIQLQLPGQSCFGTLKRPDEKLWDRDTAEYPDFQ